MSNKSLIREKIGETGYKIFNSEYPLIEGYLFQKLDDLMIMMSLTENLQYSIRNSQTFLTVQLKTYRFSISFDRPTKRIGIIIASGSRKHEILSDIYEKLNINISSNSKHNYYLDYEFKYNYKNCQRIVSIVKLLITRD